MALQNFFSKENNLALGIRNFFSSLNTPLAPYTNDPFKLTDALGETYNEENPSLQLIQDVYLAGIANDNTLKQQEPSDAERDITQRHYEQMLVWGVELKPRENGLLPTRSQLSDIVRAFHRQYKYTPVAVVFRYPSNENQNYSLAFANCERVEYQQNWREGEKAGKISLLRDVKVEDTHRGHIDILNRLKITASGKKAINTFSDLYQHWQNTFNVSVLNKKFYQELSNWYFWALKNVKFPGEPTLNAIAAINEGKSQDDIQKAYTESKQEHNATNVIRLLTRFLFVWFIKEKDLVPDELFDLEALQKDILNEISPLQPDGGLFDSASTQSIYYKAILQNLFFGGFNCPINEDEFDKRSRAFRKNAEQGTNFGIDWLLRYEKHFKNPDAFLALINQKTPYLNGGLFECQDDKANGIYIDGFTDNKNKQNDLIVPDYLFFGATATIDLSADYGIKKAEVKKSAVKGLINILDSYRFTVAENTPLEEDVALDPELLGKVFENLLASYNPETKSTARKQTGSFYTPREIVNYMVDESLIAYLKNKIQSSPTVFNEMGNNQFQLFSSEGKTQQLSLVEGTADQDLKHNEELLDQLLHQLFAYNEQNPFANYPQTQEMLVSALNECKILDPAVGSGAFPMGALQKMVHVLKKLDPDNIYWKQAQIKKAESESAEAFNNTKEDKEARAQRLHEINDAFEANTKNPDYARKLFLIENCIYGVDIQPIAVQISKLRFFISLVVEQKPTTDASSNFGIRTLPNLETKFVAANTLIGIQKENTLFATDDITALEKELKQARSKMFNARTKATKVKWRAKDLELRQLLAEKLSDHGFPKTEADKLASWDPYNQNTSSPFFDPEWMFDIKEGFDVVIGNPPYVNFANLKEGERKVFKKLYTVAKNKTDLFAFFIEKGSNLIAKRGVLSFIIPHTWKATDSFTPLRKLIFERFIFKSIVDLNFGVFEAIVKPVVIVLERFDDQQYGTENDIHVLDENFNQVTFLNIKEVLKSPIFELDTLNTLNQKRIFKMIENVGIPLNEIIEFSRGIKTSNDTRFIVSECEETGEYKKIFRGKNIKPFKVNWNGEYIWYRPDLMKEKVGCVTHSEAFFEVPEKIVTQRVNSSYQLQAAYDTHGNYFLDTVNVSRFTSFKGQTTLKSLCSIINSKVLNFWYCLKYRMPTIGIYELHTLPIIVTATSNQTLLSFFTSILSYHNSLKNNLIKDVLDAFVFNLYFPEHMQKHAIDVLPYVEQDIKAVMQGRAFEQLSEAEKENVVEQLHNTWTNPNNEVVKRMAQFKTKSPDILKPILEA